LGAGSGKQGAGAECKNTLLINPNELDLDFLNLYFYVFNI
jgi:hypothetical protein